MKADGGAVVPALLDGHPVIAIGEQAFFHCTSLTRVTIPEGVTGIGDLAFFGCPSLTSVTIPESVTTIGAGVFAHCISLAELDASARNALYEQIDGVLFEKEKKRFTPIRRGAQAVASERNVSYEQIDGVLFKKTTRAILKNPEKPGQSFRPKGGLFKPLV